MNGPLVEQGQVQPVVSAHQLDVLLVAGCLGMLTVCVLIGVYAAVQMFVSTRAGGRR